eukprot:5107952-Prymnesium_polylepis.2
MSAALYADAAAHEAQRRTAPHNAPEQKAEDPAVTGTSRHVIFRLITANKQRMFPERIELRETEARKAIDAHRRGRQMRRKSWSSRRVSLHFEGKKEAKESNKDRWSGINACLDPKPGCSRQSRQSMGDALEDHVKDDEKQRSKTESVVLFGNLVERVEQYLNQNMQQRNMLSQQMRSNTANAAKMEKVLNKLKDRKGQSSAESSTRETSDVLHAGSSGRQTSFADSSRRQTSFLDSSRRQTSFLMSGRRSSSSNISKVFDASETTPGGRKASLTGSLSSAGIPPETRAGGCRFEIQNHNRWTGHESKNKGCASGPARYLLSFCSVHFPRGRPYQVWPMA